MVCSERFQVRFTPEDRRRLRALATVTQRTEGDVLRVLVRAAAADAAERPAPPLDRLREPDREALTAS